MGEERERRSDLFKARGLWSPGVTGFPVALYLLSSQHRADPGWPVSPGSIHSVQQAHHIIDPNIHKTFKKQIDRNKRRNANSTDILLWIGSQLTFISSLYVADMDSNLVQRRDSIAKVNMGGWPCLSPNPPDSLLEKWLAPCYNSGSFTCLPSRCRGSS